MSNLEDLESEFYEKFCVKDETEEGEYAVDKFDSTLYTNATHKFRESEE